jgi:hypothetical protein
MKSAHKFKDASSLMFIYFLIVFLLLLISINVRNFLTPIKVLGAQTEPDGSTKFWGEFTSKNPDYIPGWIELGRLDKVKEIDPNFTP